MRVFLGDDPHALLAGIGNGAVTALAAASALEVSLHTADPLLAGNRQQQLWEADYLGYGRRQTLRTAQHWALTDNLVQLRQPLEFAPITTWTPALTFVALGVCEALLYSGPLQPVFPAGVGYMPCLLALTLVLEPTGAVVTTRTARIVSAWGLAHRHTGG